MVDIIDVMLAKAMTPQGQIDTYAARANKAVSDAAKAEESMNSLINDLTEAVEQANETSTAAEETLQQVTTALAQVDEALADLDVSTEVNTEVDKLAITLNAVSSANAIVKNLEVSYPSEKTETINNIVKYYTTTGNNSDGTMTQKAITDAINSAVENIPSGGGSGNINLGSENEGKIVVVNSDGLPIAGTIDEKSIIDALIKSDDYKVDGTLGLQIDYENRTATRKQDAIGLEMGVDFNKYAMYGGRMRCNVNDNGQITAFYGDSNYKDDGSNGQVMVYQPKFYYQRTIIKSENAAQGKIIRKESLILASKPQTGFKVHPLFINENGEEVEYVLLPAYEGSVYDVSGGAYDLNESVTIDFNNDKLSSIANAKPVTGAKNELTIDAAEKLARNRGTGWHITNMAMESAIQMLEMVEFGTMNGQSALGSGISNINGSSSYNCSSITGSTATLGNNSGSAAQTVNEINGSRTTYSNNGRVAISYRGMENPWGNTWRFVGGCNIYGNGNMECGMPYICSNFNYNPATINTNYEGIGFYLPTLFGWISAMGYGNEKYDWVYMPIECQNGNDATPVGDNLWAVQELDGINITAAGGSWSFNTNNGPFYYGCDRNSNYYSNSFNPRLMFIPTKNNIYNANYNGWLAKMGA